MRPLFAALVVTAACSGAALAQNATPVPAPTAPVSTACTSGNQSYSPGQIACIPGCHGAQRLARCDASLDRKTASWTTVSTACPNASLKPIVVALASPKPIQTNFTAVTVPVQ